MAHANPEFALACRAYRDPPLSTQLPKPASLRELRERMFDIGRRLKFEMTVTAAEHEAYRLWQRTRRQDAEADDDLASEHNPGGRGMHGRDPRGLRFAEPKRRWPSNVQAGRPDKPRRGTLPR